MTDWQPISTAPFEYVHGQRWLEWCLLWIPDEHGGFPVVGGMDAEQWLFRDDERACGEIQTEPTHFMPLPQPPEEMR
jgi:hypothetical protein